jgi:hypothetical protein
MILLYLVLAWRVVRWNKRGYTTRRRGAPAQVVHEQDAAVGRGAADAPVVEQRDGELAARRAAELA